MTEYLTPEELREALEHGPDTKVGCIPAPRPTGHFVFDTETTGLIDWKMPNDHPCQPNMVSLAAIQLDENLNELASIYVLVRPEGWEIPAEATAIHGITTAVAYQYGLPINSVLRLIEQLTASCGTVAGFNIEYDRRIVHLESLRALKPLAIDHQPEFFCVMKSMTDICKIPHKTRGGFKFPKLAEAYQHATGKELYSAHNALADVRATVEVYRYLKKL